MSDEQTAIVPWADVTSIGLRQNFALSELPEDAAWEIWTAVGRDVARNFNSALWAVADWIEAGETRFGEKYTQAIDMTKLSYSRLANITWVGRCFPIERRHDTLSFTHHEKVAALSPETADALLVVAETNRLSANEMMDAVRVPGRFKPAMTAETYLASAMSELSMAIHLLEVQPGEAVSFCNRAYNNMAQAKELVSHDRS